MTTPYIGYGNDTLAGQPPVKEGDAITCPHCGQEHLLQCASEGGRKSTLLMFYKCGETAYLGAVQGKSVVGKKPDVSGEI